MPKKTIKSKAGFRAPRWWECMWRRNVCGQDNCPICVKLKRDRQMLIDEDKDPDDFDAAMETVGRNFTETLDILKKEASRLGIDIDNLENIQQPPEPEKFNLYQEVEKWRRSVYKFLKTKETAAIYEARTNAMDDLAWYANTLTAKTYRQLCNRWHLEQGDDYGEVDFEYTAYVLRECIAILKGALSELLTVSGCRPVITVKNQDLGNDGPFLRSYIDLADLEKKILRI